MDIKWIEDFLALVEHGSFTKASEHRYVSQPAFGRRIKSLENWLGAELIDRSSFPLRLTEAGEAAVKPLQQSLEQLYSLQSQLTVTTDYAVTISTQHSLSTSFIPHWLNQLQSPLGASSVRINNDDMLNCVESFLSGQSDFLLCYHTESASFELEKHALLKAEVARESIIAVRSSKDPHWSDETGAMIRLVGYPAESFFGRVMRQELIALLVSEQPLKVSCETALCEGVKAMVLQGMGISWLPQRLVETELNNGSLVRLPDLPALDVSINLYKQQATASEEVESLWQQVLEASQN